MTKTHLDRVLESIDANLPDLHRDRWARQAAELRNRIDTTTGTEKRDAEQALEDHYKVQFLPETSRGPLVEEATSKASARRRA